MGLNFLGLGFNFGAKDDGLEAAQVAFAKGFLDMTSALNAAAAAATSIRDPMQAVVSNAPIQAVQQATVAAERMAQVYGNDLGQATNEAAERFQRDGKTIITTQMGVGKGFSLMEEAVKKLGKILSMTRISAFVDSVALSQLDTIKEKMDALSNQGGTLTTSFESTMLGMTKTARAATVGLTNNTDEARKYEKQLVSLAYGLNRDVGEISAGFGQLRTANVDLEKLGMSMSDFVKTTDVAGISTKDMAGTLADLQNSWKMQPEQIKRTLDSVTAVGREMGIGAEALKAMPSLVDAVGDEFAQLAKSSPRDAEKAIVATTALAGAFAKTMDKEQAMEKAKGVFTALTKERATMQHMMLGKADELGQFTQDFAIGLQDIGVSFEAMKKDPIEFAMGMRKLEKAAQDKGEAATVQFQILKKSITDTLGPDMRYLIEGGIDSSMDTLENLDKILEKSGGAFKQLGKDGFMTGLTLQEQYDRLGDQFGAKLRGMTNAGNRFVKDSREAFENAGIAITAWGKDDGPLGQVTRKMAEMHQIGAKALLPKTLQPMAGVFGNLVTQITPIVGALGAMGLKFSMLLGPIGLVAGALAVLGLRVFDLVIKNTNKKGVIAWSAVWDQLGKDIHNAANYIEDFAGKTAVLAEKWIPVLLDKISNFDFVGVFFKVFSRLEKMGAKLAPIGAKLIGALFSGVSKASGLLDRLVPAIKKSAPVLFEAFGKAMDAGYAFVYKTVLPKIGKALTDLGPVMEQNLPKVVPVVIDGLLFIGSKVIENIPTILSGISQVVIGALGLLKGIVIGIFNGIRDWLMEKFPAAAGVISIVFDTITTRIGLVFSAFQLAIQGITAWWGFLINQYAMVFEGVAKIVAQIVDHAKMQIELIRFAFTEAVEGIKIVWEGLKLFFGAIWEGLKKDATNSFEVIGKVVDAATPLFEKFFAAIDKGSEKNFRHSIHHDAEKSMDYLTDVVEIGTKDVSQNFSKMEDSFSPELPGLSTRKPVTPISEQPALQAAGAEGMNALIEATNAPSWYYDDYRPMMQDALNRLISAVDDLPGKMPVPTSDGPKKKQAGKMAQRPNSDGTGGRTPGGP